MTRRIRGEERDGMRKDAAERYAAGDSIRAIGATFNRSFGFTRQLLVEAGVKFRGRGGDQRSPRSVTGRAARKAGAR